MSARRPSRRTRNIKRTCPTIHCTPETAYAAPASPRYLSVGVGGTDEYEPERRSPGQAHSTDGAVDDRGTR